MIIKTVNLLTKFGQPNLNGHIYEPESFKAALLTAAEKKIPFFLDTRGPLNEDGFRPSFTDEDLSEKNQAGVLSAVRFPESGLVEADIEILDTDLGVLVKDMLYHVPFGSTNAIGTIESNKEQLTFFVAEVDAMTTVFADDSKKFLESL